MLSTPPAFVLSQDQTLMFNPSLTSRSLSHARQSAPPLPVRECLTQFFLTVLRSSKAPSSAPAASGSPPIRALFSVSFSRFARRRGALGFHRLAPDSLDIIAKHVMICQHFFGQNQRDNQTLFLRQIPEKSREKRQKSRPFRPKTRTFFALFLFIV